MRIRSACGVLRACRVYDRRVSLIRKRTRIQKIRRTQIHFRQRMVGKIADVRHLENDCRYVRFNDLRNAFRRHACRIYGDLAGILLSAPAEKNLYADCKPSGGDSVDCVRAFRL